MSHPSIHYSLFTIHHPPIHPLTHTQFNVFLPGFRFRYVTALEQEHLCVQIQQMWASIHGRNP